MNEMQLDSAITEAINTLSNDDPGRCAECLVDLASTWANAGMPHSSFAELRKYIVKEASSKSGAYFIKEKLTEAEKLLQVKRNGTIIITH